MASRGFWWYMSARTRRSLVLFWTALFVCSIALQYANFIVAPPTVRAASGLLAGTVQGFEIDGDLYSGNATSNPGATPDGPPPEDQPDFVDGSFTNGDDWLDGASGNGVVDPATPPTSAKLNDPTDSTSDDIFIGGAKEDDTCTWGYTTGKPTPKDDFDHVVAYAKFVDGKGYFFAGAERLHTQGGGDTTIDFELNRNVFKAFSSGGPLVADREVGDLLISLEFANGGSEPEIRIFQVTGFDDCHSPGNGEKVVFTETTDEQVKDAVRSATNFVDITGFDDAGATDPISPFDFAEVSVDLNALGINPSCPGFASGHIRSRAGGDINSSQLKDTAQPFPIDLNTCGKLRIEKRDAGGALLGGATFTISDDPRPGMSGLLTVTDGSANDPDATANGIIEFDPAEPGSYTVTETVAPSGYIKDPTPQTQTLANNGSITFVFTNNLGSISWVKNGPDGQALLGGATFSVTPNPLTGSGSLTVVDNGANDADGDAGEFRVANARVGTYSVCETAAPSGYILDPDCAAVSVTDGAPNGTIAAGTFVNTLGSIAWQKEDEDAALLGGATFEVTPNPLTGTGSLVIEDGDANDADPAAGKIKIANSRVGTYSVCETIPPDGYIGDPDCANVSVSAAAPNGTIAAGTFVNRLGSIAWQKHDEEGKPLGGATFTIQLLPDGVLVEVEDNGPDDDDPDAGEFLVDDLPTGTYEVCETVAPPGYVLDSTCRQGTIDQTHEDVDLGAFVNGLGSLAWLKHDGEGELLGGASFSVDPFPFDGVGLITVVDDSTNDADPDAGELLLVGLALGQYRICETEAPAGYVLDTTCRDVTLTQESPDASAATPFVNTLGSVSWVKHDQDGKLLGGATFSVTLLPDGAPVVVEDNGPNDGDDDDGEFLLEDLPLGTYRICETAAPTGYILDPDCQDVEITQQSPDGSAEVPFVNTLGSITWEKHNEGGQLLGGATFTVDPDPTDGDGLLTVEDNTGQLGYTGADADPTAGAFLIEDVPTGSYEVCETVAPDGYLKDGTCKSGDVTDEEPDLDLGAFVNTLGSISWIKTKGDESDTRLAGATFEVDPNPYGGQVALIVVDCTASPCDGNDQDPDGGEFLLGDVPVGTYTITETSAPEGYEMDTDTCDVTVDERTPDGDQVCEFQNPPIPPVIDVVKTAGQTAGTQVADGLTYFTESFADNTVYKYVVTNTGDVRLIDVELWDDNGTPLNEADDFLVCEFASLDVDDSEECLVTASITQDTTNIVTASGKSVGEETPVSATDDADVEIVGPAITIIKTAGDAPDGGTYVTEAFPDNVTYQYAITNTGEVTLLDVEVVDDNGTPADTGDDIDVCTIESLAVGVTANCDVTLTVLVDTTNVAVATGHTAQQPDEDVTDDDDAIVDIVAPAIAIVKTAGDAEDGEVYVTEAFPDNVTYTYEVTNTGEVDLLDLQVVDDNGTPDDATDDIDVCALESLAIGESAICEVTLTVLETTTNVAIATGETDEGTEVEDDDDAIVRVPDTDIDKSNDDEDGIVGHGQTVTYTIDVTVFDGPVTDAIVIDELPAGQTYVDGSEQSAPAADDFEKIDDEGTIVLVWSWNSLEDGATITYDVTIDADAPAGDQTNIAEICVSELAECKPDESTVTVPELVIDKSFTGNTGGEFNGIPEAKVGDTLTYTLAYVITNPPVHNGVITDTLPEGLAWIEGSATDNDEFEFVGIEGRTLTWNAVEVTKNGFVTYQVEVLEGADELPQPLVNVATIDSDETDEDDDDDRVFVEPPPQEATATPTVKVTLPPTDGIGGGDRSSNPGFSLMLVLLALAGFVLTLGFITPVPERVRRRNRRR